MTAGGSGRWLASRAASRRPGATTSTATWSGWRSAAARSGPAGWSAASAGTAPWTPPTACCWPAASWSPGSASPSPPCWPTAGSGWRSAGGASTAHPGSRGSRKYATMTTEDTRSTGETRSTEESLSVGDTRPTGESRSAEESRSAADTRPTAESRSTGESRSRGESRSAADTRSAGETRPVLLVIGTGMRHYREYLLASIAPRYRVHLFVGAEPTWEREYIGGWTVLPDTLDAA